MKNNFTILLAPDAFKESMTAKEACDAMARGIKKANPSVKCIQVPMADGGEGTMQSLVDATGGQIYAVNVTGPLGNTVKAQYGILGDGKTGVIEMASASGIHLVPLDKRNPLITTTYGTGQLIKACLDQGVTKLLIGIGGSATNDGGIGALQALGAQFLDEQGKALGFGGGSLERLTTIDVSRLDERLLGVLVEVACDVTNPLCGVTGASHVFGPQKGASQEMVKKLDENLAHYANIIENQFNLRVKDIPGAGAAGGLGAGLMAFANGKLVKGIDLVMAYTQLEKYIQMADVVWTGEGRIDAQTQFGKTPLGVAKLAKQYNKPVVAFAGSVGEGSELLYGLGIDTIFAITNGVLTIEEALSYGMLNLEQTAENVMRLMSENFFVSYMGLQI